MSCSRCCRRWGQLVCSRLPVWCRAGCCHCSRSLQKGLGSVFTGAGEPFLACTPALNMPTSHRICVMSRGFR